MLPSHFSAYFAFSLVVVLAPNRRILRVSDHTEFVVLCLCVFSRGRSACAIHACALGSQLHSDLISFRDCQGKDNRIIFFPFFLFLLFFFSSSLLFPSFHLLFPPFPSLVLPSLFCSPCSPIFTPFFYSFFLPFFSFFLFLLFSSFFIPFSSGCLCLDIHTPYLYIAHCFQLHRLHALDDV